MPVARLFGAGGIVGSCSLPFPAGSRGRPRPCHPRPSSPYCRNLIQPRQVMWVLTQHRRQPWVPPPARCGSPRGAGVQILRSSCHRRRHDPARRPDRAPAAGLADGGSGPRRPHRPRPGWPAWPGGLVCQGRRGVLRRRAGGAPVPAARSGGGGAPAGGRWGAGARRPAPAPPRGPGRRLGGGGAHRPQPGDAALRDRHRHRCAGGGAGRYRRAFGGHPQDHPRPAVAGEVRRALRWRRQSPARP